MLSGVSPVELVFCGTGESRWFDSDPQRAWGFYGHRLNLYRNTQPHAGFGQSLAWGRSKPLGYFVFTSNVDGQFQRAGFDAERIVECHGSIHHLQCSRPCSDEITRADDLRIKVDESDFARLPLPDCPHCGSMPRPNVLMFGDGRWLDGRTGEQWQRYEQWCRKTQGKRLAILEFGAGTAVPTVRCHCECHGGTLIRINPREPSVGRGGIAIPLEHAKQPPQLPPCSAARTSVRPVGPPAGDICRHSAGTLFFFPTLPEIRASDSYFAARANFTFCSFSLLPILLIAR